MRSRTASATCPTCQTSFSGVEVEYDGFSGYAALEVHYCADPNCGAPLCSECAQFHCDGCGERFCMEHAITIPDGDTRPLLCCAVCAAECEVAPELPDVCCPACHSDDFTVTAYDFGRDAETGYQDAGERFACRACGETGDADELERHTRPARIAPQRETAAAMARPDVA